uniref:Reverse transcriptase/retrotransposon-derived protein RNase H-like domain-containing protein n=1 Tax=Romanomermis culicivorax TaxID=13658 RepID=A0A915HHA5_ROMCU
MEGRHMIKCIILDDSSNDQCIIGTNSLAHPHIHAILISKTIQNVKLLLKVTKLFLRATYNNVLEEILGEDRLLNQDQVTIKFTIETAIINITNGKCPLLFVNNTPNIYNGKAEFIIQTDASTTAMGVILYQESGDDKWDYDYKIEYVKGKDNACADCLSPKDDHKKPPIPSTKELANEIFHPQLHAASKILNTNPTVRYFLSWAIPASHNDS